MDNLTWSLGSGIIAVEKLQTSSKFIHYNDPGGKMSSEAITLLLWYHLKLCRYILVHAFGLCLSRSSVFFSNYANEQGAFFSSCSVNMCTDWLMYVENGSGNKTRLVVNPWKKHISTFRRFSYDTGTIFVLHLFTQKLLKSHSGMIHSGIRSSRLLSVPDRSAHFRRESGRKLQQYNIK